MALFIFPFLRLLRLNGSRKFGPNVIPVSVCGIKKRLKSENVLFTCVAQFWITQNRGKSKKLFSHRENSDKANFRLPTCLFNGSSEHSRNVSMSMNKKEIDTQENDFNRLLPKIKTVENVSIRAAVRGEENWHSSVARTIEEALMALVTPLNVRFCRVVIYLLALRTRADRFSWLKFQANTAKKNWTKATNVRRRIGATVKAPRNQRNSDWQGMMRDVLGMCRRDDERDDKIFFFLFKWQWFDKKKPEWL